MRTYRKKAGTAGMANNGAAFRVPILKKALGDNEDKLPGARGRINVSSRSAFSAVANDLRPTTIGCGHKALKRHGRVLTRIKL